MRRISLVLVTLCAAGCAPSDATPPPIDALIVPRDAFLDVRAVPPVVPSVSGYCDAPTDCDDGDPCTVERCEPAGMTRFEGTCRSERIEGCVTPDAGPPDAGRRPDAGGAGPGDPVDPSCASGESGAPLLLPYVPLGPPDVDLGCEQAVEYQNCAGAVSLRSSRVGGARARTLVIDVATYTAPDRLRVHGIDGRGEAYVLLDTCRIRTAEHGDPTDGHSRPPDEVIRRFEVELREGTRALTLDATDAPTPWYMRVLGLCDLEVDVVSSECSSTLRDCVP